MGLLDDLKTKVDTIKIEELKQNAEFEAQEEFYSIYLQPAMKGAYDYLSEIVKNLNIITPEIYPAYPLDPSKKQGVTLSQGNYKLDFDNPETPHQIDIRCKCILEQPHDFHISGRDAVLKHTKLLESYNFPFHRKDLRDKRHKVSSAKFFLEGPMVAHIRIHAHSADRCIYIHLRNIEEKSVKLYKFSPEKVDDQLLERLARVLIREESTLVKVAVSDEFRTELRYMLELDKRRDEEDLANAIADLEAEKQVKESMRLTNRAKNAVALGTGKALGFMQKIKRVKPDD